MRLDKYLAHSTGLSRKDVQRLLKTGAVEVNGEVCAKAARHIDPDTDAVCLDDMPLATPSALYLMLNKPVGFVCANDDPTHPTVLSLLDLPRAEELIICGRLDIDTTGLVLITSDGQWAHRITSPKHKTGKRYQVKTADPIPDKAVEKFQRGLMLNNEKQRTKPAELEIVNECEAEVILHEGRYHQVKRMFAALGNRVIALHRSRIGDISLDPSLEPGEYRELTEAEVRSCR